MQVHIFWKRLEFCLIVVKLSFFSGGFPKFIALHLHLSYNIFERGEGSLKKKKSVVVFPLKAVLKTDVESKSLLG
jgi:hypothetical protein